MAIGTAAAPALGAAASMKSAASTNTSGGTTVEEHIKILSGPASLEAKTRAAAALEALAATEKSRVEIFVGGGVRPLVQFLGSSGFDGKSRTLRTLLQLAGHSQAVRNGIFAAGGIPVLLTVLKIPDLELQASTAAVLTELCAGGDRRKMEIVQAGAVQPAVAMLSRVAADVEAGGSTNARAAVGCMAFVAALAEVEESVPDFVSAGALPLLVTLLHSSDGKGAGLAASALVGLAGEIEHQLEIERLGAVQPLVRLLSGSSAEARGEAAGALAMLSLSPTIAISVIDEGALPSAVALLTDGSDDGKVMAAKFFMNLTSMGPSERQAREAVMAAGALVPLMMLLAKGSPQGRARAAGALKNIAKDADCKQAIEAAVPLAAKPVPGGVQTLREAIQRYCF